MKKIRTISLLLALVLTFLSGSALAAAEPTVSPFVTGLSHTVDAKSAMLIEMNTGQILLEQNADAPVYPASLTKIMTCMLVLEHGKLTDEIIVSESALENLSIHGSTAGLLVGERLTMEQLLYCMMLSSANEACNIAAEYVSGSVDAFVQLMNQRAAELGCTGTHFANTHGLQDETHYTTARDLSLIVRKALENETFQTITSAVSYEVPPTNLSEARQLTTTNLLVTPGSQYYYEYASGIKTGFTTPAGLCLISTADNGKLKLLSIVCGAQPAFLEDGTQINQNFTETKALFEYGFDNFIYTKVLNTLNPITQIPVHMSAGPDESLLAPNAEITALLPADYDETKLELDIQLTNPNGVAAPITKGQVLGTVTAVYQGHALGTVDLTAIIDIPRSEIAAQAENTKTFFELHWWKLLICLALLLLGGGILFVASGRARWRKRREQLRKRRRNQQPEIIELYPRDEE